MLRTNNCSISLAKMVAKDLSEMLFELNHDNWKEPAMSKPVKRGKLQVQRAKAGSVWWIENMREKVIVGRSG